MIREGDTVAFRFVLVFVITIMSAYFNREDELENYLERYNDEFELKDELNNNITKVLLMNVILAPVNASGKNRIC